MWRTFSFTTDETVFKSNTPVRIQSDSHIKVRNEKLFLYTQKSANINKYKQIISQ